MRTGRSAEEATLGTSFFGYLGQHPTELAEFADAMGSPSEMIAAPVVELLDPSQVKDVVDMGGGASTLMAALLYRNPAALGTVLELPEMAPAARPPPARCSPSATLPGAATWSSATSSPPSPGPTS